MTEIVGILVILKVILVILPSEFLYYSFNNKKVSIKVMYSIIIDQNWTTVVTHTTEYAEKVTTLILDGGKIKNHKK